MEQQHQRQAAVLRRKVEQAAAANKRLKDALTKRETAQDQREAERGQVKMADKVKVRFATMITDTQLLKRITITMTT